METLKFMWFQEGEFVNPKNKDRVLKQYIYEEKKAFFEKNIFRIPQIEISITTRCTLKCKDCCALIPQLDNKKHIIMTTEDFKLYIDRICNSVDMIRQLIILGGEPLIHPHLAEIIEYAAKKDNIYFVRLITNGTVLPNEKLLNTLKKYNKRCFVYISNYAGNEELSPILKNEQIKRILKENDIKCQSFDHWTWNEECGFQEKEISETDTKSKMLNCYRTKCNTVINGHFDICSKMSYGRELGLFEDDSIDILNSKNLREDLIKFYQKEYFNACSHCVLSDKKVIPALQTNISPQPLVAVERE